MLRRHRTAFPASPDTICQFLEAQSERRAPSTIRRRLYSIRKLHRLLRLPDPTYDEEINLSFRRIKRQHAIRPKQAKGLTRDYLDRFLASEPDTPWGLRNRAMLSLGYELLARRSELVALRSEDLARRDDGTLKVLIRRSKSDPFGAGRLAFTSQRTASLVEDWLTWRGPHIPWLFCPIYQGKVLNRGLEITTVKRLIKNAARRSGLSPSEVDAFSGHSMRVGAAQDLLCAGYDTAAIMRAGGWKSVNILARYLEKAEHNVWGSDWCSSRSAAQPEQPKPHALPKEALEQVHCIAAQSDGQDWLCGRDNASRPPLRHVTRDQAKTGADCSRPPGGAGKAKGTRKRQWNAHRKQSQKRRAC